MMLGLIMKRNKRLKMAVKITEETRNLKRVLRIEWDSAFTDKRPVILGISKAKKVLAAIPAIEAFVASHKKIGG
jgi:hypothetical protein